MLHLGSPRCSWQCSWQAECNSSSPHMVVPACYSGQLLSPPSKASHCTIAMATPFITFIAYANCRHEQVYHTYSLPYHQVIRYASSISTNTAGASNSAGPCPLSLRAPTPVLPSGAILEERVLAESHSISTNHLYVQEGWHQPFSTFYLPGDAHLLLIATDLSLLYFRECSFPSFPCQRAFFWFKT